MQTIPIPRLSYGDNESPSAELVSDWAVPQVSAYKAVSTASIINSVGASLDEWYHRILEVHKGQYFSTVLRRRMAHLSEDLENVAFLVHMQEKPPLYAHNLTDLGHVLAAAAEESKIFGSLYNVEYSLDARDLGRVAGDWVYLKKALECLLKISARHAKAGTNVRVRSQCTDTEVVLIFEAIGSDIPESQLPLFFRSKLDPESPKMMDDLGLAPALAENIITRLGGFVLARNLCSGGIRLHAIFLRNPPVFTRLN